MLATRERRPTFAGISCDARELLSPFFWLTPMRTVPARVSRPRTRTKSMVVAKTSIFNHIPAARLAH